MKIKAIFLSTTSRSDINGNRYHILSYVDTATGASVEAMYHTHHAAALERQLGLEHGESFSISQTVGIREFNRMAKTLPHYLANDFIAKMNEAKKLKQIG